MAASFSQYASCVRAASAFARAFSAAELVDECLDVRERVDCECVSVLLALSLFNYELLKKGT